MASTTNYAWSTPDNSGLVKNGAQDIRTLGSAVDTSLWNVGFGQAGKNKIINGNFGVWQRGTSGTLSGSTALYVADRFYTQADGSGGTITVSQQAFTAGTAPVAGYEGSFFHRVACSVARTGTTFAGIYHKVEDVRTFAGQQVTLSFWAKADTSRTVTGNIEQNFGSGGSSSVFASGYSFAVTSSWTRFSYTVTLGGMTGKTIGTSSFLNCYIDLPKNTTSTIDIWGVQLEYGSVATPFQTATGTIQGELAACQRYYYRNAPATSGVTFGQGSANGSRYVLGVINLPVSMRIAPTSAEFSALTATDGATAGSAVAALAAYGNSTTTATYYFDCTSGLTQYRNYKIETSSSSGYLGFSAEL